MLLRSCLPAGRSKVHINPRLTPRRRDLRQLARLRCPAGPPSQPPLLLRPNQFFRRQIPGWSLISHGVASIFTGTAVWPEHRTVPSTHATSHRIPEPWPAVLARLLSAHCTKYRSRVCGLAHFHVREGLSRKLSQSSKFRNVLLSATVHAPGLNRHRPRTDLTEALRCLDDHLLFVVFRYHNCPRFRPR